MNLSCLKKHRTHTRALLSVAVLVVLLCLTFPQPAHAWLIEDITQGINDWVVGIFADVANGAMKRVYDSYISIADSVSFTTSLQNAFGYEVPTNLIFDYIHNISELIVKPLAATVLSFVVLIRLIKISSHMDSHGTIPALKELGVLFVELVFFMWIINHAFDLMSAVYDLLSGLSSQITHKGISGDAFSGIQTGPFQKDATGHYPFNVAELILAMLVSVILMFLVTATHICVNFVVIGRAFQIYTLLAFAPLALSLIGIDETRSWALGYIKHIAALGLANVICVIIMTLFAYIVPSILVATNKDLLAMFVSTATPAVILSFAIFKSGSWAQGILGS